MPSIADLDYEDSLDSAKQPILTDWRASLDSIETYVNDSIKDNLVQLASDAYGSAYAFDSDSVAQYTANLYNKTFASDSYTGGDVTISTTGAWTDVETSNAAISVTPELTGDFRVEFQFNVESVTSNATNATNVKFRLTDSSEESTSIAKVHLVTGVTGTTNTVSVVLAHTFEDWSAVLKTVKLQYFITTTTATTIKVLASTSHPIYIEAQKT